MQLGLIEGIFHLVRKYTRRKTRYKFLDPKQVGMVQDVVVDEQVVSKEVQLGPTTNCQPHTHSGANCALTLYLRCLKRPPTIAARWITCVGLYFSKILRACAASLLASSVRCGRSQVGRRFTSDPHPPSEGRSMSHQASSHTSSPPQMIR